jgi:hypothetical protein
VALKLEIFEIKYNGTRVNKSRSNRMLGYLFENRNKTLKSVLKIADCLGRSLRENVQLFSMDSENRRASFLTESMHVIEGTYGIESDVLSLTDVLVEDSEIYADSNSFNDFVSDKVRKFVGNIFESEYQEADSSFDDILHLWGNRLQFNDVKKKIEEKALAFSHVNEIISTSEFQKLMEVAPQVVTWLKESKNTINSIPEIKNAIKLSDSVSKAFNIPYISIEQLKEDKQVVFDNEVNKSVYEMLCKQELVSKELYESKNNFDLVWANNDKLSKLSSYIYKTDEDELASTLSEALCEIPYLALASKRQLRETFSRNLNIETSQDISISEADIKKFSSLIFEMKKPVKSLLIKTINEKYGVNVQNLKQVASFRGLVEAQVVIFESLQRLAPRNTVIKSVFSDISNMLKEKAGVEAIDVNNVLQALFEKAELTSLTKNTTISDSVTLQEIFEHELTSSDIITLLEETGGDGGGEGSDAVPEVYAPAKKKKLPKKKLPKAQDDGVSADKAQTPEEVQAELSGKAAQYAEATEEETSEEGAPEEEPEMSKKDFFKAIQDFTEVLKGQKKELPEEEEEEEETSEEPEEEAVKEETAKEAAEKFASKQEEDQRKRLNKEMADLYRPKPKK